MPDANILTDVHLEEGLPVLKDGTPAIVLHLGRSLGWGAGPLGLSLDGNLCSLRHWLETLPFSVGCQFAALSGAGNFKHHGC